MRLFATACVFLALMVGVATSALAQEAPSRSTRPIGLDGEALAALVAEVFEAHETVSLGAAIIDLNGVAHMAAVGERALGSGVPVTTEDLWHIGSDTKAMTATLLARLDAQGVIDLDATLAELLPDLASDMHEGYAAATLPQLLAHGIGVAPNPGTLRMLQLRASSAPLPEQRLGIARRALSTAPAFEPGTGFQYSNIGFIIVGVVAETHTDQSWEDLITAELFTPLGMTTAGFGAPGIGGDAGGEFDQPRGHRAGLRGRVVAGVGAMGDNPLAFGPAGSVHLSLEDWGRFGAEHLRGARGDSDYLSADLFQQLHTAASPSGNYGYGWGMAEVETTNGPQLSLRHAGSNTMWFAIIDLHPEQGLGILVVTNDGTEEGQIAASDLTQRLRTEVFGEVSQ